MLDFGTVQATHKETAAQLLASHASSSVLQARKQASKKESNQPRNKDR